MFRTKQRVCPDVCHTGETKKPPTLNIVTSPRAQQGRTQKRFLHGGALKQQIAGLRSDCVSMSSSSPSLCSPSCRTSSFALIKFDRRSLFSSFSSECFRFLIISTKYDCIYSINFVQRGTITWLSSQQTYPKLCQTVPNFLDTLSGSPFEDPTRTKQLDE